MNRKMGVANQQIGKSVFLKLLCTKVRPTLLLISLPSKLIYGVDPHNVTIFQQQFMKK